MMKNKFINSVIWISFYVSATLAGWIPFNQAEAAENLSESSLANESINFRIKSEISKIYPRAMVQLNGEIKWMSGKMPKQIGSVQLLGDDAKGNMHFKILEQTSQDQQDHPSHQLSGQSGVSPINSIEGWVPFSAWIPAKVAIKRVRPGETLKPEFFTSQNIDVAIGRGREYRGVIVSEDIEIAGLESIQTVLEGQFLTSTAIQRKPDVRRGDLVRINLKSGDLTLSTSGRAEEPGYLGQKIRVMTQSTKRELTGNLTTNGLVEVVLQ